MTQTIAKKMALPVATDMIGFWVIWHLEGGFEGMRRLGMSRATIYRRIKTLRLVFGVHPDEFEMPGIKLNIGDYRAGWRNWRVCPRPTRSEIAPTTLGRSSRSARTVVALTSRYAFANLLALARRAHRTRQARQNCPPSDLPSAYSQPA